ncbi:MAG: TerC family protein [Neisseriaceae bacterium]
MDAGWLLDPNVLIGFLTLVILEIVLGIDNLVFVAIVVNKASPQQRDRARVIGLSLAIIIRILMLAIASYLVSLTRPLFTIATFSISGKDILMMVGGFFLIYKATSELHEKIDADTQYLEEYQTKKQYTPAYLVTIQILLIDAVFSLDSVMTSVGMVDHIIVAMFAVSVAMVVMIIGSKYLTEFINHHPTVVVLCLCFLLMIGLTLILEGFHKHIPKGYLYASILFAILIEILNQVSAKNLRKNAYTSLSWRRKTIDSVLGMLGIREAALAHANQNGEHLEDQDIFEDNEKNMIRSVLTLAEKPVESIITPRREIAKLNLSKSLQEQREELKSTPYGRLIVVGKAGIEEPLGYISKKDVLSALLENQNYDLTKLIKQPLFIPNTATVLSALELFRRSPADIALVVDEFGAILGLLSIKDITEAIAGEFPEEYEQASSPSIQTNEDNSITVDGSLDYDTLAQKLNLPPLPENTEFHSVAGLLMEELQRIPNVGDTIEYYDHIFEVIERSGQKIQRVRIKPLSTEIDLAQLSH